MNIAVLGGGITGLTAAWRVSAAGHSVRVFESADRVGGAVRSESVEGWLAESGPNSFQETPEIAALIDELGLGPERVQPSPEARNRYVARKGRLVALPTPSTPSELVLTPLLSLGTKMRIMQEATLSPRIRQDDASVASLVRDHFGGDIVDSLVQPFISGIWAGDAEKLSARHAFPGVWEAERTVGSFVRAGFAAAKKRRDLGLAATAPIISFRRGLQTLTDALASRLPAGSVILNAEVRSIGPGTADRWHVDWKGPEGPRSAGFDCVIAALPAWSLAQLKIGRAESRPLEDLSSIEYPPMARVFVGFRRDQVGHPLDGFGALVPASENRSILGVIFSSSLYPGRAPAGHVALTAFTGGALRPDVAMLSQAESVERACEDLRVLVGATGNPSFVRHVVWPRSIPQYNLGYGLHLDAMAACELTYPGLYIGGNVRDGISIPSCIKSGVSLANRVS